MRVVVVARDLIVASRIGVAAARAGVLVERVDSPDALPPPEGVDLLLVDWGDRGAGWGPRLAGWCADAPVSTPPRVVLFGPHVDLAAHAEARGHGLGPMQARSRFFAHLDSLFGS